MFRETPFLQRLELSTYSILHCIAFYVQHSVLHPWDVTHDLNQGCGRRHSLDFCSALDATETALSLDE